MDNHILLLISVWALPVLIAITFHEAAHAFVARVFGDDTAAKLGRVSLNPLRHVDPFGTVLLPAMLLLAHSPFLFGYAKPVPVNFAALRYPRLGMALVAAAGPLMNIGLALLAALSFRLIPYFGQEVGRWIATNLKNALVLNVWLAVFNLFPIPPLDGGRIAVALLPRFMARPFARLQRVGMLILLIILVFVPLLGSRLGYDVGFVSQFLTGATQAVIRAIVHLTGLAP